MAFSIVRSTLDYMKYRRSIAAVAVGTLVGMGACTSTPLHYYGLTPQNGQVLSSGNTLRNLQQIEVLYPSVPEQLDRDTMVRSVQSYRVELTQGAAWSEPLGVLIGHTLTTDLAQRLPGRSVFSQNDAVVMQPQATVALSVTRFDVGDDGHATIEGIISAKRGNGVDSIVRSEPVKWVSSQPVGKGPNALAEALSQGVGAVADQAARLCGQLG